jgi:hypothetical protein
MFLLPVRPTGAGAGPPGWSAAREGLRSRRLSPTVSMLPEWASDEQGSKRRTRRANKQRTGARQSQRDQRAASSTEVAVAEAYERFARYVQSASSHEDAAAAARADLRSAVEEVARLACGLDLIKVVSSVRVVMIMNRTMTGVDVSAAVLELIALVLACRDSSTCEGAAVAAESGFMPPHVEAAAREVLAAGNMMALFYSPPSDAESAILFYSVQREIALRNPVYP